MRTRNTIVAITPSADGVVFECDGATIRLDPASAASAGAHLIRRAQEAAAADDGVPGHCAVRSGELLVAGAAEAARLRRMSAEGTVRRAAPTVQLSGVSAAAAA